jgi:hypothetical protein
MRAIDREMNQEPRGAGFATRLIAFHALGIFGLLVAQEPGHAIGASGE